MEAVLTRGAVATIAENQIWHRVPVVLQVLDTVWLQPLARRPGRWSPNSSLGGYTLVLSDGVHTHEMDLITPLRHLVKNGRVRKGSVIRLVWYCTIFAQVFLSTNCFTASARFIAS
jgi:hypothetical protein